MLQLPCLPAALGQHCLTPIFTMAIPITYYVMRSEKPRIIAFPLRPTINAISVIYEATIFSYKLLVNV